MKASLIEEARTRLASLSRELENALATATEEARPVALDLGIGRLSRMDAIQQQERALHRLAHLKQRIALTRQALGRLEEDEYGYCMRCGDAIAPARLLARPEVPVCLPCQEAMEAR